MSDKISPPINIHGLVPARVFVAGEPNDPSLAPTHGPSKGYHEEPAQAVPNGWDWDAHPGEQ